MKKVDRDQGFAAQVKTLCDLAQKCMQKNNQIDMYEEYFLNEESEHVAENLSLKTLMLFKYGFLLCRDPPGICKRTVS
jgi:dynein intermediate chain 2